MSKTNKNTPIAKKNPQTREEIVNQLAANIFLSVWDKPSDESTDETAFKKVLDRIQNDENIPEQLKLDVYNRVIISIGKFTEKLIDDTGKAEVRELWMKKKQK